MAGRILGLHQVMLCIVGTLVAAAVIVTRATILATTSPWPSAAADTRERQPIRCSSRVPLPLRCSSRVPDAERRLATRARSSIFAQDTMP